MEKLRILAKSRVFFIKKRLREEGRDEAIVLVGIVDPVRVELELTIVPVEVRGVREVAIGVRIFAPVHLKTPEIEIYAQPFSLKEPGYILSSLNFIWQHPDLRRTSAPDKSKQYLLKATHS